MQDKCPKCGGSVETRTRVNKKHDGLEEFRCHNPVKCLEQQLSAANARADQAEARVAELVIALKHIGRVACGEDQVAEDDTEGLAYIYKEVECTLNNTGETATGKCICGTNSCVSQCMIGMVGEIEHLQAHIAELVDICEEFVAKVETGRARSVQAYERMKNALANAAPTVDAYKLRVVEEFRAECGYAVFPFGIQRKLNEYRECAKGGEQC